MKLHTMLGFVHKLCLGLRDGVKRFVATIHTNVLVLKNISNGGGWSKTVHNCVDIIYGRPNKYHITYLHNLTKTADIAWAFDWMARIVSLLLPAQKPPPTSTAAEAACPPVAPVNKDLTSRLEDEGGVVGMGFDWSMMVHSASCTVLSSCSHNCTGLGRLKRKGKSLTQAWK